MKSEILSTRELRIYKNQVDLPSIGILGQEKIKNSKVLIVGAGGKGTSTMQNLSAAGLGHIAICDNHIVEETALPRQSLYGHSDLGKQKAIISKQRITQINQIAKIDVHNIFLSETNIASVISGYEIIVDTTDNFSSHFLIDKTAEALKKPVVFCTISDAVIIVSVFHFKESHSLRQLYPTDPEHQNKLIHTAKLPGEVIQYSIAGSLIANEVLKMILGISGVLDGFAMKFDTISYRITIDAL